MFNMEVPLISSQTWTTYTEMNNFHYVRKVCMHCEEEIKATYGIQGWRSGESTHLPPMWPGFNSQIWHHMWVEFAGSLLCTERFSLGTPVSPLLKSQHLT